MNEGPIERIAEEQQERAWIEAFRERDKSGFDGLVLKYKDPVFNLCYRMLGDYEEAGDCAQETFVKVYRSLAGFRFQSRFSTWLYAIAVNTCKNRVRSAGYRRSKEAFRLGPVNDARDGDSSAEEIRDPGPSPLAQLEKRERDAQIQKAIDALPQDARTVVVLRDIDGLSYEEISGVTGYNPGTVRSKLARARLRLRELLKGVI